MKEKAPDDYEWVGAAVTYFGLTYGVPLFLAALFVFLCWKGIAWAWAALFGA